LELKQIRKQRKYEFEKEMEKIEIVNQEKTDLEKKWENTDRFQFTNSRLERYDEVKKERAQNRN